MKRSANITGKYRGSRGHGTFGLTRDQIDKREQYTLWQKVGGHWVIERSFAGHYILSAYMNDIEKSWNTSRPYGVFPRGEDPNMRQNPKRWGIQVLDTINDDREVQHVRYSERTWNNYLGRYEHPRYVVQILDYDGSEEGGSVIADNQGIDGKVRWFKGNPTTGMTKKGRRMEREVARTGTAYAPSAVVYGAAKRKPGTGLVTKKWARKHGYPRPNPKDPDVFMRQDKDGKLWRHLIIVTDQRATLVELVPAMLGGWYVDRIEIQEGEDSWGDMSQEQITAWIAYNRDDVKITDPREKSKAITLLAKYGAPYKRQRSNTARSNPMNKRERDRAASIAYSAYHDAEMAGENWADMVDERLEAAGFSTLDPVAYGAEQETDILAVIKDNSGVLIIRYDEQYDEATTERHARHNPMPKTERARAANIAFEAYQDAEEEGENWADWVDEQLEAAGFVTLDPVPYGAEQDTSILAVIEDDDGVLIIRYDEQWGGATVEREPDED